MTDFAEDFENKFLPEENLKPLTKRISKFEIHSDVDFADPTLIHLKPKKRKKSAIVCTLADPNLSHVELQKIMENGMNVIRFKMTNFSNHQKVRMLAKVSHAAEACCKKYGVQDWPIATCVELKTCNTKTGLIDVDDDCVMIKEGTTVIITNNLKKYNKCNKHQIFVDNLYLKENAVVGNEISIKEDEIVMKILEIVDNHAVKCVVTKGGALSNIEQVAMKSVSYAEPLLSNKDYEILQFALDCKIDMIVINYVRCAETLKLVKKYMKYVDKRPALFAGICTNQCIENIDSIIAEADGIILSRDILTYELQNDQQLNMIRIQKWLCAKCLKAGKTLYIAGGIFDEAVKNGIFYDSEIFDVSNALMDGASGFILNDCFDCEYTIQTLKIINDICGMMEGLTTPKTMFWKMLEETATPVNAAKAAAVGCLAIANQSLARAIIIPTVSGITAKCLLDLRPSCLVYTVSTCARVLRKLASFRSIIPLLYEGSKLNKTWKVVVEERVECAILFAVKKGLLVYGDNYVTLHRGHDTSPYCDTVQLWTVAISKNSTVQCPE